MKKRIPVKEKSLTKARKLELRSLETDTTRQLFKYQGTKCLPKINDCTISRHPITVLDSTFEICLAMTCHKEEGLQALIGLPFLKQESRVILAQESESERPKFF